jgi:hypothetical protein
MGKNGLKIQEYVDKILPISFILTQKKQYIQHIDFILKLLL